jgi:hypothetical protein
MRGDEFIFLACSKRRLVSSECAAREVVTADRYGDPDQGQRSVIVRHGLSST